VRPLERKTADILRHDTEGYIVYTASMAGLISYHANAAYHVSKHSVVAISEKLHYDLVELRGKVKSSVLCPERVRTRIMDSSRNPSKELEDDPADIVVTPEREAAIEKYCQACEAGMSPNAVAEDVFQAIRDEKFYIM